MNNKQRLQKIIAPLALGIGLTVGIDSINSSAIAYPDNSTIYSDYSDYHRNDNSNYHRDAFRDIQPFRSLNVTPRYTPSRYEYYRNYDRYNDYDRYDDDNCDNCRQRRVFRRGIRQPDDKQRYRRNYYPRSENRYIRIRVR
jgi:hypothetical protein